MEANLVPVGKLRPRVVEPRTRSQGAWFCSSLGLLEETNNTSPRPRGQDAPCAAKTLRIVTSQTGRLVGSPHLQVTKWKVTRLTAL